jgi:hypothetical protein
MQDGGSNAVTGKAMYSLLFSEAHMHECMQNYREDWYSTITGKEDFTG